MTVTAHVQLMRRAFQTASNASLPDPLPDPPAAAYGKVSLRERASLHANLAQLHAAKEPFHDDAPASMEQHGIAFGVMDYWCDLDALLCLRQKLCSQHAFTFVPLDAASIGTTAKLC